MSTDQEMDFSELDAIVAEWGLPTTQQRIEKRLNSSMQELREFHDRMLPHLEKIIEFLNQFSLDAIPERYKPLANAALAMCEVDDPVNRWRSVVLEEALDPRRFTIKSSFYDTEWQSSWGANRR